MPQVELSKAEVGIILSDLAIRKASLSHELEMLRQLENRLITAVQESANPAYRSKPRMVTMPPSSRVRGLGVGRLCLGLASAALHKA
jgi:hypothetical protein